jgi:hypothetical protein
MAPIDNTPVDPNAPLKKKPVSYKNLLLGACKLLVTLAGFHWLANALWTIALNLFEVSTLGQPFEVIKTQLAANRGQSLKTALSNIYSRGGVLGFYQGLIPWAWIEASTKGAVLLFTASEFEYHARAAGASPFLVSCYLNIYEKVILANIYYYFI